TDTTNTDIYTLSLHDALPISHEKAQDLGNGAEGVHVIVVKTQAQVGVGEIRIQSLGAQEVFASAHSGAGRVAILGAQSVKPCRRDRKSTRLNSSHVAISYAVF